VIHSHCSRDAFRVGRFLAFVLRCGQGRVVPARKRTHAVRTECASRAQYASTSAWRAAAVAVSTCSHCRVDRFRISVNMAGPATSRFSGCTLRNGSWPGRPHWAIDKLEMAARHLISHRPAYAVLVRSFFRCSASLRTGRRRLRAGALARDVRDAVPSQPDLRRCGLGGAVTTISFPCCPMLALAPPAH